MLNRFEPISIPTKFGQKPTLIRFIKLILNHHYNFSFIFDFLLKLFET